MWIALTTLLVLLNGFFVAAEFALVKVRRGRLEQLVEERRFGAATALWLVKRLDRALSACQLGITMASLGLGWAGEPAVARVLEPLLAAAGFTSPAVIRVVAFVVGFSIITAAHLVIGEQAPKIFAIRRPEGLMLWCAGPLWIFYILFYPPLMALSATTAMLLRLVGVDAAVEHDLPHSEEEIRSLVSQAHAHGEVSRSEQRLIDAVFEFDEVVTRQIMVPRLDVVYFDATKPLSAALAKARETMHTRFPLCDGSVDNVLGVVHLKDLVGVSLDATLDLRTIMRPPRFVPETLPISRLLAHFQAAKQHMALVVDEYGALSGIVTLENVLERIVGSVEDEFDAERPAIIPDGPNQYLVDGRASLEDADRVLGLSWSSRDVDTVSGFIMQRLGRVPAVGDRLQIGGVAAEVLQVRGSRATRVRVTLPGGHGQEVPPP